MSLVWQVRSCTPPPSTLPKLVGACFVPVRNCWKVTRNLLKFWRFPACSRHEHEVSLCHQPRRQGVVAFVFLVLMKLPIENLAIHTVSAKMDAVCGSARAHSGARRKSLKVLRHTDHQFLNCRLGTGAPVNTSSALTPSSNAPLAASIATRRRTSNEYFSAGRLSAPSSGCRLGFPSAPYPVRVTSVLCRRYVPSCPYAPPRLSDLSCCKFAL